MNKAAVLLVVNFAVSGCEGAPVGPDGVMCEIFVTVLPFVTVESMYTTTVSWTLALTGIVTPDQVTICPVCEPPLEKCLICVCAGKVSTTTTLESGSFPVFVAVITYCTESPATASE
jgi:hypothetical protein